MPPKRTRGGTVKAGSSKRTAAPEEHSSNDAKEETTQSTAQNDQATELVSGAAALEPANETNDAVAATSEAASTAEGGPSSPAVTRTSSTRGRGRGTATASQPRRPFAPKTTTRRSQAERESLSASEAVKQAERDRTYAAKQAEERRKAERLQRAKEGWNTDRRGRGRGGYMGDRKAGVSGPFSQGTAEGKTKVFVAHSKSGAVKGEQKSGSTRVKTEDGEAVTNTRASRRVIQDDEDDDVVMQETKAEDGGYISSDEEATGPKKDVDTINLISDDEEGGTRRERASSMRPVRLKRVEHRDRRAGAATESGIVEVGDSSDDGAANEAQDDPSRPAATSKLKAKTKSKDVEIVGENRIWQGTHRGEDEPQTQIKEEPDDDVEMTVPPPQLRPQSPETTRRLGRGKGRGSTNILGGKKKPAFNTDEEEAEWERYQQDLQTLVDELGGVGVGEDGDLTEEYERTKSEHLYLFQFPPVLPELRRASADVKPEPEASVQAPSSPKATKRAPTAPPMTSSDQAIKIEDDGPGASTENTGTRLEAGALGKLRVHQSGKITLDYGGTSLQLNKGLDASFLQDAVITKMPAADDIDGKGLAYALGPVRGKFVITPDFGAVVGGNHW